MSYSWMLKPKFLVFIPLILVLLIAIACGADPTPLPTAKPLPTATPQPTATPAPGVDTAALTALVERAVKSAAPPPAEVISAAEIKRLVETAVAAAAPKGATAAEVKQLVEAGVAAVKADAASKGEVASLVSKAVADATATLPEPVSAAEIEKIVKAAIPATPTPAPTATPPPAIDPRALVIAARYGGVVPMMAFPSISTWDPYQSRGGADITSNGSIYNQLVERDPINPGEIIGDLAESWDVSPDGLSFTFQLRKDVKWTDGEVFDADDVVFSLDLMVDPTKPRPRAGNWKAYTAEPPGEKVDQNTVKMNLSFPAGAFLAFLAVDWNKILPQHVLEAGVDISVFNKDAVGTGPWRHVDWKEGISTEERKNADYFKKGRPYFDGIKAFVMTDKGTEIAAYKTGRILMGLSVQSQMDVEDALKLEADQEFMAKFDINWMAAGAGGHSIFMNTAKKPFDDPNVRRALFLALDRQQISDHFGKGRYSIGAPMSPKNPFALPEEELLTLPGYRQLDGKKHPDDIAEAQRLLTEAGFADGLKTSLLVATIIYWPDAGQVIQAQLKNDVNMDIELVLNDIGTALGKIGAGDYELAIFGAGITVTDPDDRFGVLYTAAGSRNFADYEVPGTTELFNRQQREPDPDKRRELNYELQRLTLAGPSHYAEFTYGAFAAPVSKRIRTEAGPFIQGNTQSSALKHDHEWLEPE